MSRKTPIRKTKRRLKRSVRRSLAAVLMITAIVIAAVPVPENYADGEETTESTDLHDMEDFGYDASDASDLLGSSVKLDKYANVSADDLIANEGGSYNDVKMSLSMRQMDSGGYEMSWQFMYYTVTISSVTRGIVCKYNNLYLTSELTFPEIMNEEYYTVTTTKYSAYYDSASDSHNSALNGMTSSFDPTQSLEYTYNDWNNAYGTNTVINNYFENYYSVNNSSVWNAKITEFETYKKNGGDDTPSALTSTPANDLTEAQKLRFYCDNDTALSKFGSGFTLVSVQNSTPGSSGTIYVAYDDGSATLTTGSTEDDYGFLVKTTSDVVMVGIGDSTFEGVSQVESMTIPNILYIGDDAFSGATMLTSVNLKSVTNIGNRAFKGCTRLASVEMSQAVATIGNECFYNTAITSITLPMSLTEIGYGAFADCTKLTTVDLDFLSLGCVIGDYAFYNCSALTSVEMSDAVITSIGAGAFAVASGGAALDITFPQGTSTNCMSSSDSIGNYMFAGRTSLGSVVFPRNYGTSTTVTVPVAMFHGCVNLQYVEFPADETNNLYGGSLAKYEGGARDDYGVVTTAGLFSDVTNSNFYVKGPKTTSGGAYAYPRTSTWTAVTAVSDVVPYLYVENGVEYYEVSDGDYLLCIDEDGVLTSCTFRPNATSTSSIDLVIPSTVGNTTVTGIASDCFWDDGEDGFNQAVRTLTIKDGGKLSSIEDGAFQGWLKLTTVYIGDSVTSIGDEAFEGCTSLIDVTFASPASGVYTGDGALTIGEDAFATGSSELTFHGDIVEGYAPFEWAMDPDNVIKSGESIRVCYRSLFPTCLTVMYNPNTELVTLLDYPKYDQISDLLNEAYAAQIKAGGYGTYEAMMESRYYTAYADSYYDTYRVAFAALWNDTDGDTDAEASAYASDYYGPWINEDFCDNWSDWVSGVPSARASGGASSVTLASAGTAGQLASHTVNTLLDWLFEPITVYAASNSPQAYYDKDPYDVIENQVLYAAGDQYRAPTEDESNLIYATQNIVVPAGVGSIDVYGYYKNYTADGSAGSYSNGLNITTYLSGKIWDTDTYKMYISSTAGSDDTETVPGLFSGYYVDYDPGSEYETAPRGNDWITSVTLNSVEYLPDYAFDSCERLQYVILGDDCADIGTSPFRGCYALQTVSNNDYYTTENGIVYSVNTDGSYTIEECLASRGKLVGAAIVSLTNDPNLENVSEIKASAFEDCDYITTVDLSTTAGLATIPEDCFKDCDSLQTVVLPRTVNYIESGAFAGADKLSSLTIYGTEVYIAGDAFEEDTDKVTTTVYAYEDSSAERYVDDNGTVYKLQYSALSGVWTVMFLDAEGQQAADIQYVEDGAYADDPDVDLDTDTWTFTGWLGTNNTLITDKIYENTIFIAQGYSTSGMVNGKYVVEFYDGIDGSQIGSTQYIEPGEDAIAPQAATHTGYTFSKWSDTYTNIQSNKTIMALYTATSGSSSTTTTTTSTSSSTTSSTTSSSASSSTSSTSSETSSTEQYVVTVINGSGSGSYAAGTTVIITANTPASGQVFSKWTTDSAGVTLASVSLSPTTFTMPSNNVTITAEFTDSTASSTAAGTTSTGTATTSTGTGTDSGNTRVDITKPGISNKDLATANVNGSTDNFVIKISETDEATQAVAAALTNKYESLENILYYAMDITLWDSTGTYQLTEAQTEGLTVDITIPIPDALVAYGGNNMAGAVINDNQLENLNENFTTINGVPCIRFTATHFSPYTIYVDTGNLTEGMLDVTPQTGDPIHPKWFLSIGLACLSIILFMKKDKNVTPKTA